MLDSSSTTATALSSSTSPPRTGRLRGLSYLRNYTHLHSSSNTSRNNAPPLTRAQTSPASPNSSDRPESRPSRDGAAPSPQRSDTNNGSPAQGWLPTVGGQSGTSRVATTSQTTTPDTSAPDSAIRMARTRADTVGQLPSETSVNDMEPTAIRSRSADATDPTSPVNGVDKKDKMPTIRLIPHLETRSSRPSLPFPIINRTLPSDDAIIRVGRYSERDNQAAAADGANAILPVGFKSKVVSRRHCEFWCSNNQWYVKDVKSSSGTFLNHVRLSPAGTESKPYPINDGDIVQLGIDFKGGEEVIFRCVKIRVECNRSWQKGINQFNTQTHKRLRNLASGTKDSDAASTAGSSECAICLNPVAPCQALFVAPCSHVWHYKCIRTIIYDSWPSFQCPNCRAYADLEADIEEEEFEDEEEGDTDGDNAGPASSEVGAGAANGAEELSASMQAASLSARSATPTSTTPFALAAALGGQPEGPMTPRNEVGPFVLDATPTSSGRRPSEWWRTDGE